MNEYLLSDGNDMEPDTLSGNDIGDTVDPSDQGPGTVESEAPGTDADEPDIQEPDVQKPDTQRPEPETPETEDKNNTEQEDETSAITNETQSRYEEIMERLDLMQLPEDETGITERLDALIMLMTPKETGEEDETETYASVSIPFEGYEEWIYPITMQYQVYPYGAGYWMEATETFTDISSFTARYGDIVSLCQEGGTLKDFYIEYIWEDSGSDERLVYDYEAKLPEPDPDPGEEEAKETVQLLLSHLENINTTLAGMTEADMEYYQLTADYRQEMLQLQTAETATTIFTCIGVFGIFTALLWEHLFRRFR